MTRTSNWDSKWLAIIPGSVWDFQCNLDQITWDKHQSGEAVRNSGAQKIQLILLCSNSMSHNALVFHQEERCAW